MKRLQKLLTPPFLSRLDKHLLLNYPAIWATKVHYVLFYGVLSFVLLFGLTFLFPTTPASGLPIVGTWIFLSVLAIVPTLFWMYKQTLYSIEKLRGERFYSMEYIRIGIYILCLSIMLGIPVLVGKYLVHQTQGVVGYAEIIEDIDMLNKGNVYFPTLGYRDNAFVNVSQYYGVSAYVSKEITVNAHNMLDLNSMKTYNEAYHNYDISYFSNSWELELIEKISLDQLDPMVSYQYQNDNTRNTMLFAWCQIPKETALHKATIENYIATIKKYTNQSISEELTVNEILANYWHAEANTSKQHSYNLKIFDYSLKETANRRLLKIASIKVRGEGPFNEPLFYVFMLSIIIVLSVAMNAYAYTSRKDFIISAVVFVGILLMIPITLGLFRGLLELLGLHYSFDLVGDFALFLITAIYGVLIYLSLSVRNLRHYSRVRSVALIIGSVVAPFFVAWLFLVWTKMVNFAYYRSSAEEQTSIFINVFILSVTFFFVAVLPMLRTLYTRLYTLPKV
ncbi:MAG: hypothetical protein JJT94_02000 [Bernardetiaceae bacterium]|nr:hypothetical protein [Bernardetiaceae bacterium]